MTLSSWFREYVYIPLGGNRVGRRRWIFNLFLVWALTGLWHGAAWTFLVWGLLHGSALLLEKLWLGDLLRKGPAWLAHCYVILVVLISMVIFNGASLGQAFQEIGSMFGAGGIDGANPLTWYYLRSYGLLLLIGIIGSLPWIKKLVEKIAAKLNNSSVGSVFLTFVEPIVLIGLFLLVTAYLVDGSFNPFLYFRF